MYAKGMSTRDIEDHLQDIYGVDVSASFWTTVFNELKNRGVKDILIASHDNLTGFSNALNTVYPKT